MLSLLRRMFAREDFPALRNLAERVTALERTEAERERVLAEQLQRLANYWKRIRQREAYDAAADESPGRPPDLTRAVLDMKLRSVKGGS